MTVLFAAHAQGNMLLQQFSFGLTPKPSYHNSDASQVVLT
jgi:hypothetical protein